MATITIRNNTAANAASNNRTLAAGEPGYTTDDGVLKIGDGSTAWNSLPVLFTDLYAPIVDPTFEGTMVAPAINGGTAANDDLTIQGTSNSTRTTSYVLVQPNGGKVGVAASATASQWGRLVIGDAGAGVGEAKLCILGYSPNHDTYQFNIINVVGAGTVDYVLQTSDAGGVIVSQITFDSSRGVVNIGRMLNLPTYTNSSPVSGDLWYDGTNLKFRDGSTTRTITWT